MAAPERRAVNDMHCNSVMVLVCGCVLLCPCMCGEEGSKIPNEEKDSRSMSDMSIIIIK